MHGSDPPTCSTHARITGGGAPKGNQNALKHGFYSRLIRPEESAQLVTLMQSGELDDELAMTRVVARRVLERLESAADIEEFKTLVQLHFLGMRTIAGLIKAGGPTSTFRDVLDAVLNDLGHDWNASL